MKRPLFFLALLLTGIVACKKDNVEEIEEVEEEVIPTQVAADFRDTVTGNYTGNMRHVRTTNYGAYTTLDTTYPYTLHVTIDTSSTSTVNSLWMDGIEMDANSTYAVHMNYFWGIGHPRQSASGQFTLYPTYTHLSFFRSDSWNGTADAYTFNGDK